MGRPSLAPQRRAEILEAVGRCVARYGVDGTTLEKVSEESGLGRGHIRHYLGNREELIYTFAETLMSRYVVDIRNAHDEAPPGQKSEALLAVLFGSEWRPGQDDAQIDSLLVASARDTQIKSLLRSTYLSIERVLTRALAGDIPSAGRRECAKTAYALMCLAFGNTTFSGLSLPASRHKAARTVATALVDQLRLANAG